VSKNVKLLVVEEPVSRENPLRHTYIASSWDLHLIVVRRFEYADDPKSYTSGSLATGRASHAGKVEG
jgi:hypothetical protein